MIMSAVFVGMIVTFLGVVISRRYNCERALFGYGLLLGAFWYAGFAVANNVNLFAYPVQIAGIFLFAGLAILGLIKDIRFIAFGWIAHIFWDFFSPGIAHMHAPWWTAWACAGFDQFAGVYLLLRSFGFFPLTKKAIDL